MNTTPTIKELTAERDRLRWELATDFDTLGWAVGNFNRIKEIEATLKAAGVAF